MVSIEEHKRALNELLNDIEEKVKNDMIIQRQKLIGFAASEASCDLFSILLHRKNLISPGFNVNHRFFSSEKIAKERFDFDIPKKDELVLFLVKQDMFRSLLCYGKPKERKKVEEAIENLYKIKELVESVLGEDL